MKFSEVGEAIEGMGAGYAPASKHFHGGPDRRMRRQVIMDLGLQEGMTVELAGGGKKIIRKIDGDDVFVHGVPGHINVYGIVAVL